MVKGPWGQPEITLLHNFQTGGWVASNASRFGDPRLSGMVAEEGDPEQKRSQLPRDLERALNRPSKQGISRGELSKGADT